MQTTNWHYRSRTNEELAQCEADILCDRDGEPLTDWSRDRLRTIYDEMRRRNALRKAGTPAIFQFADDR